MELQYQGQTGKSEVQVLRERLEEVKDRLASADNKVGFLTKEKEEQFRAAVEQKAELERRDRVIKELEGVLRFKEEEFNARFRDIDAELQNRINTHKADLNVKNE
jgi:chromosome segregation ATPase